MPNGIANIDIEMATPIIQSGVALLGGSGQRVAWEVSTPLGFITTGILWAGGLVGSFVFEGLGKAMAVGLSDSGAAVAGWVLTEQFLLGPASRGGSAKGRMRRDPIEGLGAPEALGSGSSVNGSVRSATSLRERA